MSVRIYRVLDAPPWNDERISCGSTERDGGVGEGGYASLNTAHHVGDNPEHVIENRCRIASEIDIPFESWIVPEQVHSANVVIATETDRGKGSLNDTDAIPKCDGLLTGTARIALIVQTADCLPVFMYNPKSQWIGILHAGWRGLVGGIIEKACELVTDKLGQSLIAASGLLCWTAYCGRVPDSVGRRVSWMLAR